MYDTYSSTKLQISKYIYWFISILQTTIYVEHLICSPVQFCLHLYLIYSYVGTAEFATFTMPQSYVWTRQRPLSVNGDFLIKFSKKKPKRKLFIVSVTTFSNDYCLFKRVQLLEKRAWLFSFIFPFFSLFFPSQLILSHRR